MSLPIQIKNTQAKFRLKDVQKQTLLILLSMKGSETFPETRNEKNKRNPFDGENLNSIVFFALNFEYFLSFISKWFARTPGQTNQWHLPKDLFPLK